MKIGTDGSNLDSQKSKVRKTRTPDRPRGHPTADRRPRKGLTVSEALPQKRAGFAFPLSPFVLRIRKLVELTEPSSIQLSRTRRTCLCRPVPKPDYT
jgi:hypothetical protein